MFMFLKLLKIWKVFGIIVILREWLLIGELRYLFLCLVLFLCFLRGYVVIKYIKVKEIVFFIFFLCYFGKKFCFVMVVYLIVLFVY